MGWWRKKPIVVEAIQWFEAMGATDGVRLQDDNPRGFDKPYYVIDTLEGPLRVAEGDWIITGVKGERYPCKPDIFEATYERADNPHEQGRDIAPVESEPTLARDAEEQGG